MRRTTAGAMAITFFEKPDAGSNTRSLQTKIRNVIPNRVAPESGQQT